MNSPRIGQRLAVALSLALLGQSSLLAVRRTEDPLALVPAGAVTVGVIHWNELRTSPLGAKVFAEMDEISTDGDAARFLEEAQLDPRRDVDTIIVAMSPAAPGTGDQSLVFFEGRFDVDRLSTALLVRGGARRMASGTDYFRLPARDASAASRGGDPGALAFINRQLIVAGDEPAVVAALARRESGGAGSLMSGQGLGRYLARIRPDASAWALVDLKRFSSSRSQGTRRDAEVDAASGEPGQAIVGAMKSVSTLALQASVESDGVELSAQGLTGDAEARGLLEDSLRGVLAMWRLAAQEKSPETVSVLRRFQVENDGEGVSIRGKLPASFLRALSERHAEKR